MVAGSLQDNVQHMSFCAYKNKMLVHLVGLAGMGGAETRPQGASGSAGLSGCQCLCQLLCRGRWAGSRVPTGWMGRKPCECVTVVYLGPNHTAMLRGNIAGLAECFDCEIHVQFSFDRGSSLGACSQIYVGSLMHVTLGRVVGVVVDGWLVSVCHKNCIYVADSAEKPFGR